MGATICYFVTRLVHYIYCQELIMISSPGDNLDLMCERVYDTLVQCENTGEVEVKFEHDVDWVRGQMMKALRKKEPNVNGDRKYALDLVLKGVFNRISGKHLSILGGLVQPHFRPCPFCQNHVAMGMIDKRKWAKFFIVVLAWKCNETTFKLLYRKYFFNF